MLFRKTNDCNAAIFFINTITHKEIKRKALVLDSIEENELIEGIKKKKY
jgi:hypothetical protein